MKHVIIDKHDESCHCHKDYKGEKSWISNTCNNNPVRFLFFHDNDFHIITYFKCIESYDQYDFKELLLKLFIEKAEKIQAFEIVRGWNVEDSLKEQRLRGLEFDNCLHEVNYLYSDMCGKEYAIATKVKLYDKLEINGIIGDNYQLALEFIRKDEYLKGYKSLYHQLENLRDNNKIYISDAEIIRSTKHLTKVFKKQIKDKTKTQLQTI